MPHQLAIIGAGNMAEAIVRGVTGAKLIAPEQIIAADVSADRLKLFREQLHVATTPDNAEAARDAEMVLLSVKPQMMAAALATLAPVMKPTTLVVSIAAGVRSEFIESHLGSANPWRVVRTMPNTPMLVGAGAVGIAAGRHATQADLERVESLFASSGIVIRVREDQLNAVTALSGSGPAYVFYLVEQMTRAGIEMGLSPEQAALLARQTAAGAGKMLATAPEPAEELRRRVTSPGGTTHAAITYMQSNQLDKIIIDAIKAAEKRGKELGG